MAGGIASSFSPAGWDREADRRNPVLDFRPELLEPLLQGRSITSVKQMSGGKSTTNHKVVLQGGHTLVLRQYAGPAPRAEAWVLQTLSQGQPGRVPVPSVLHQGPGFVVLSFVPGSPLSQAPPSRWPPLVFEASKILALLPQTQFNRPGQVDARGQVTAWPFSGCRGFFNKMLNEPAVQGWIGAQRAAAVGSAVSRHADKLAQMDAECGLVHGDFNPANILIHQDRVRAVLDWEFSHAGTAWMDVGNLLRQTPRSLHGQVREGLLAGGMSLERDWKQRAALVDLAAMLEFLTTHRAHDFKARCVKKLDQYLEIL